MTFDRVPSANEEARRGLNSSFGRDSSTRMDSILAIDNCCCSQNRVMRKRVNFSMSRNVSPFASRYRFRSHSVPFQDNTILCIRSAVCNAISLFVGRDAADRLWKAEASGIAVSERRMNYAPSVHHFTHVQRAIRADHHGTVSLYHVPRPPRAFIQGRSSSRLPLWRSSDVSWFLRLFRGSQAGVYVLRITDIHHVQHAVCVDARMEPALIYDCAERYATQLKDTSLHLFCPAGDPNKFHYFDDVRLLSRTNRHRRGANQSPGQEKKPKNVRRDNSSGNLPMTREPTRVGVLLEANTDNSCIRDSISLNHLQSSTCVIAKFIAPT